MKEQLSHCIKFYRLEYEVIRRLFGNNFGHNVVLFCRVPSWLMSLKPFECCCCPFYITLCVCLCVCVQCKSRRLDYVNIPLLFLVQLTTPNHVYKHAVICLWSILLVLYAKCVRPTSPFASNVHEFECI